MKYSISQIKKVDKTAIIENNIDFFAFGFGSGLAKFAPGTFGTLAAIPLIFGLSYLSVWAQGVLLVLGFVVGIAICGSAAKDLGQKDPSSIVWDEIVGFGVTMFLVPWTWQMVLLGFVLFRFFDILKPWPISYFDKHTKGGLGIMIDDIIAGFFAWLVLQFFV